MSANWQLFAGTSYSYNHDNINLRTGTAHTTATSFVPQLSNSTLQGKAVVTKNFPGLTKLYIGAEYQNIRDGIEAKDSITKRAINENFIAGFVESDVYYSSKVVSKVGVRYEYSSLLNKAVIAPRVSVAYKLNDKSQASFAYGTFYQKPETNYEASCSNYQGPRAYLHTPGPHLCSAALRHTRHALDQRAL
jgi:outer membrane receptor for ferrienterochelin and colicin